MMRYLSLVVLLMGLQVAGCVEKASAQTDATKAKRSATGVVRYANSPQPSGIGIDATGGPTIDPTENVKALVAAEKERSNDLRFWQQKYFDSEVSNLKEIAELRAGHQMELRSNDIERFANIRQVDITNSDSAAAQTQVAIKALADGVENTRKTLADAQAQLAARVDERLGALERSESLVRGTARVADPQLVSLTEQVANLVRLQAASTGKGEGADTLWRYIAGALGLLITFTGAFVIARRTNGPKPA